MKGELNKKMKEYRLKKENSSLKDEKDKMSGTLDLSAQQNNFAEKRIRLLEEENKQLRKVLEKIVSEHPACFNDSECPHNGGMGYDTGCFSCPCFLAEEALKKSKKIFLKDKMEINENE